MLADANFPTTSVCREGGCKEIRADGHNIPDLLEGILQLMPLDTYVYAPVSPKWNTSNTCGTHLYFLQSQIFYKQIDVLNFDAKYYKLKMFLKNLEKFKAATFYRSSWFDSNGVTMKKLELFKLNLLFYSKSESGLNIIVWRSFFQ